MPFSQYLRRRTMQSAWRTVWSYYFGKKRHYWVHSWRWFFRVRIAAILFVRKSIPLHPIYQRRPVRLWVDGAEAFSRIEELIDQAKHTIVIRMFIWKDDETGRRIADRLVQAADRGVEVDISKDATGDMFELHHDFVGTASEKEGVWHRFWSHPRIHAASIDERDHAKVFIIDGELLLLGGMNIADEYRYEWHDFMVEVRGVKYVQHYLTGVPPKDKRPRVRLVMNTPDRKEVRPAVLKLLESAQSSIVLEQSYFSDPNVLDLLIRKSQDKVVVTFLFAEKMDAHNNANLVSADYLLKKGRKHYMRIFLYPRLLHSKLVLVDRKRAFLGSANLMPSSMDVMGELNILFLSRHGSAMRRIRKVIREDILISKPMTDAPRIGWITRFLAWLGV